MLCLVSARLRPSVAQASKNLPPSLHAVTCPLDPNHVGSALPMFFWAHPAMDYHGLKSVLILGLMAKRQSALAGEQYFA